MYVLAPSILSADFNCLGEDIKAVKDAGAKYLHIDVMDGMFVPSISYGMPLIKSIRKNTDLVFDVHLMINDPDRYIEDFSKSGADIITVHAETCNHLDRTIQCIKENGCKAGVAVNPSTPLNVLKHVLDKVDMILIMSVNPGFGGQTYIDYSTEKIKELKDILNKKGLTTDIEVDGGVNIHNIKKILDAGANIIVAGSAVFKGDKEKNVKAFLEVISEYE